MTVQQTASAFQADAHGEFARLRSDFMDEFARLEIAVGRRLAALEIPFDARKCCFDQLIRLLAKAKASPRLSKAAATELARLPQACEPLQRVRASMAHGVMEIATTGDGKVAIFRNATDVIHGSPACYALAQDDLRQHIKALAALTERTKPASLSSPRPRVPGAAACP